MHSTGPRRLRSSSPFTLAHLPLAVLLIGCADDASGLDDANALALTPNQTTELCRRTQGSKERLNQALATLACTDVAREEPSCDAARTACIGRIVPLDFDTCASEAAAQRATDVFRMNVSFDPFFSEVFEGFDMEAMTRPADFDATCVVKVRSWIACVEANADSMDEAADGYRCTGGDDLLEGPPPRACVDYANAVAKCTRTSD